MNDIVIPLGWNAIRCEPLHQFTLPGIPDEVLMSDTMGERRERIWGPLQLLSHLVVNQAFKRSHDEDEARYHRNRPALKTCPYDPACRFC
jgi:hypothetical protein